MKRLLAAALMAGVLGAGCGVAAPSGAGNGAGAPLEGLSARTAAQGGLRFPVLFRRGTGRWYYLKSFTASGPVADDQFFYGGDPTDLPVSGDWDGDGDLDVGVYRRGTGKWYLLDAWTASGPSSDSQFTYGGNPYDVPLVGDFDGNGVADPALYRSSTQTWYLLTQRGPGGPVGDLKVSPPNTSPGCLPLVGDWDGDGLSDLGTYEPATGQFRLDTNRDGQPEAIFTYGGAPTDRPLSGDFDGDGDDDPTLYRAATGEWFALTQWNAGGPQADLKFRYGGDPTDFPVVGDWDSDGTDEAAVYRVGTGWWYLVTDMAGGAPSADIKIPYGGAPTDLPVTSAPALLAGPAPSWRGLSFPEPVTRSATRPNDLELADMNGDGELDAVTSSYWDKSVRVYLGAGDGTFGAAAGPTFAQPAWAVAVGDLDEDGHLDVAATTDDAKVQVALGNGDGTLGAPTAFGVGARPMDVGIADLDADGNLDLVTTNNDDDTVSVLRGQGNGTFLAAVAYNTRVTFKADPAQVLVLDVTADGLLDLVVANNGRSQVAVLDGNGDATFDAPRLLVPDSIATPYGLASADFNEDGFPDVAVQSSLATDPFSVTILLSTGAGAYAQGPVLDGGQLTSRLATADVDGDGNADVVSGGGSSVSVLRGKGDGTFHPGVNLGTPPDPDAVRVADLDGDGRLDFLAACNEGSALAFLSGDGAAPLEFHGGSNPYSLDVADLDGDGADDMLVADGAGGNSLLGLCLVPGNGDGTFDPLVRAGAAQGYRSALARDVNRDGRMDLVALGTNVNTVGVFLRGADGSYTAGTTLPLPRTGTCMVAEDLDRNGTIDLAVSLVTQASTLETRIYSGDGAGGFTLAWTASRNGGFMVTTDYNLDGLRDLVLVDSAGTLVRVQQGPGPMQFPLTFAQSGPSWEPAGLLAVDLDRDGYDEILGSDRSTEKVLRFDRTLVRRSETTVGTNPARLAASDMDGDGLLDIVVACETHTWILTGQGNGLLDAAVGLLESFANLVAVVRGPGGAPLPVGGSLSPRVRVHVRS